MVRVQYPNVGTLCWTSKGKRTIAERMTINTVDAAIVISTPKSIDTVQVYYMLSLIVFERELTSQRKREEDEPEE
jgi:hypothetical protein